MGRNTLPDEWDHCVSFREGFPVYLCSKPKQIREKEHSESSLQELQDIIENNEYIKYDNEILSKIGDQMLRIILKHQILQRRASFTSECIDKLKEMNPIEKLRYLSRTYFDCEPIIMKERNKEE